MNVILIFQNIDVSVNTCNDDSSNTPRKVKLKKNLVMEQKKSSQRKLAMRGWKERYKKERISKDNLNHFCDSMLKHIQAEIVKSQFVEKKVKWSTNMKIIAINLYYASPKGYKNLRRYLRLPSISVLRGYVKNYIVKPGISPHILASLRKVVGQWPEKDKCVSLLIDELSLKERVLINNKLNNVSGVEDLGNGRRSSRIANSAMCCMIKSLGTNYHQLISYVLSRGPFCGINLKNYVLKVIKCLDDIGIKVMNITSDQGSNFCSLAKNLNVTFENPYFNYLNRKITFTADVPHLLKSIRNCLLSNYIKTEDGIVNFEYIRQAYLLDSQLNFKLLPKITENHVNLGTDSKLKMSVKIAAQVLSRSMSKCIEYLIDKNHLPSEAKATAQFCCKVNEMFDLLNLSASQQNRSPFHHKFSLNSETSRLLLEKLDFVKS